MRAYKGFNKELTSVFGDGKREKCCFIPGETKTVEKSKTASSGFHCCENPFDCLTYYGMDGDNRFFVVEAAGDIDEDENQRIACTQITLLEELTPERFALEGMKYMIEHPDRDGWEQNHVRVTVQRDKAQAAEGGIAIARGSSPRVRGPIGSILGLIVENAEGIKSAKILVVREDLADRWLEMKGEREVQVVEEKND